MLITCANISFSYEGKVALKNMSTGEQELLDISKVIEKLK